MKKPANHLDPSSANAGDFLGFQKMSAQERAIFKISFIHPWMTKDFIILLLKKFSISEISKGRIRYGVFEIRVREQLGKNHYLSYHKIKIGEKK